MRQIELSEGIRLGAMTGPQCFGAFFVGETASCALGSAALACLGKGEHGTYDTLQKEFPILNVIDRLACPACRPGAIYEALIPHLNDDHRWTREQIADWIETIERAEAAKDRTHDGAALPESRSEDHVVRA